MKRAASKLALGALLLVGGCVAYTSERPQRATNLYFPLAAPVWSGVAVEAPAEQRETVEVAVAGLGVAGELPEGAPGWSARVNMELSPGRDVPALAFCTGLTFGLFPYVQWQDVVVTGELLSDEGEPLARVEGRSEIGVMYFFPMSIGFWYADSNGAGQATDHARKLTRYVLMKLYDEHQRLVAERAGGAESTDAPTVR